MIRESFVFYQSFHKAIEPLPPESYKTVMIAINNYALYGEEPELSGIEQSFFILIKHSLNMKSIECGDKHWNWKGGITSENHKIRESTEYKHWVKSVFKKDKYICQICGRKGGKLNAHHVKSFKKYPALRLEVSNGITYCERCHRKWHKVHGKGN